jgi:hypothetical protein
MCKESKSFACPSILQTKTAEAKDPAMYRNPSGKLFWVGSCIIGLREGTCIQRAPEVRHTVDDRPVTS